MGNITLDSNVTAGPILPTDSSGSTHYPISKLVWGAAGTFTNVTADTNAWPVNPVTDTGRPLVIRGLADSHIDVHTDSADTIRIANDTAQAVTVRGATDTHVPVLTDSGNALHVRGLTDSHVAVTGDTGNLIPVRGATDSGVPVRVINDSALLTFRDVGNNTTADLVKGTPGYLWGYYLFNPDTGAKAYVHLFNDTAVVLGTDSDLLMFGLPPLGAANIMYPKPIPFSAGISVASTLSATSTAVDAPTTAVVVNLFYE